MRIRKPTLGTLLTRSSIGSDSGEQPVAEDIRGAIRPPQDPEWTRNKFDSIIFGLAVLAMVLLAWTFVPANYHVVHNMTWRYAEPSAQYPASKHIVLTFDNNPNDYIGIYSPDLGRYLESLPDHRVEVLFEVSPVLGGMHGRDWFNPVKLVKLNVGRLRGHKWHQPVEIGGIVQWTTDYSYNSHGLNANGADLWQ